MIKSARVLGARWTIKEDPDMLPDDDDWGRTNPRTRTIVIHPEADQPSTLIHEFLHTLEFALGLELEEEEIQQIAKGISAIFADNKELVQWFAAKLEETA